MPRTKGAKNGVIGNNINQQQFESLCSIMCTRDEICAVLSVSDVTINSWCKETYGDTFEIVAERFRNVGKASLRRSQFVLAEKNPTLSVWLGKQYLGQTDKIEETTIERVEIINDIPKEDE